MPNRTRDLLSPDRINQPLVRKRLSADEIKSVRFVQKALGVDIALSKEILFTDLARTQFLQYKKAQLDVNLAQVLEKLQNALKKSIKAGKMNDVKSGSFAIGILRDKLFQSEKEAKNSLEIAKGVTVNLGFKFTPYKEKDTKPIKGKEVRTLKE